MGRGSRPVDRLQEDFWRHYVHVGVITYGLGGLAGLGYVLATPHGPHRGALLVLDAVSVGASIGLFWWLGVRLTRTRWRTAFFSSWTMTTFAFIGTGAVLDGGTASPMSYFLVLPLLFAGLAYSGRTVSTLTCVGMLVGTIVGVTAAQPDAAATVLLVATMLIAGLLTGSMARNRARLTGALVDAATHDGLTMCLTRRAFYDRLQHEVDRCRRYGKAFSVVLADLDHLKSLNDDWGHDAGDEALRSLAGALRGEARGTDVVGRLGGDEFGLVLPETGANDVGGVADRLLRAIRAAEGTLSITASLGTASWSGPKDRADALMHRADVALYRAKKSGRDRYCSAEDATEQSREQQHLTG